MPEPEVEALGKVAEALADLEEEERARVIQWAANKYGVGIAGSRAKGAVRQDTGDGDAPDADGEWTGFPELFDAANPKSDPDRALVAGYWLQEVKHNATFTSGDANRLLKDMGHQSSNITQALNSLKGRTPRLVLQTAKHGNTKQARKDYKVSVNGVRKVEQMLGGTAETEDE